MVFLALLLSLSLHDPVSDYAVPKGFYRINSDGFVNAELSVEQEFDLLAPKLCFIESFNETNTRQSISDSE